MADNSLIMNGETETSAGADQLTTWLKDLDRHRDAILTAIREGRVKVTTTARFSQLAGRLRENARAYADAAFKVSELTTQKVILTNTIYYLLKSCERIAGHADKIGELMAVLPLGEALDAKTILGILLDGKKRDTLIEDVYKRQANGLLPRAAPGMYWLMARMRRRRSKWRVGDFSLKRKGFGRRM